MNDIAEKITKDYERYVKSLKRAITQKRIIKLDDKMEKYFLSLSEQEKKEWRVLIEGLDKFAEMHTKTEKELINAGIKPSQKNLKKAMGNKILGSDVNELNLIKE